MRTTTKDFELFVNECEYWEKRFELNGWDIDYYHKKCENDNAIAEVSIDLKARSASVTFNKLISNELKFNIKQTAKHEMIHCLIGVLSELGSSRYVTEDELIIAEEELVRKLEKIIK